MTAIQGETVGMADHPGRDLYGVTVRTDRGDVGTVFHHPHRGMVAVSISGQHVAFPLERVRGFEVVSRPKGEAMTAGQVAKRLRVARRTVMKWCDSGRLAHRKTATGEHRISPRDLAAFREEFGLRDYVANPAG